MVESHSYGGAKDKEVSLHFTVSLSFLIQKAERAGLV